MDKKLSKVEEGINSALGYLGSLQALYKDLKGTRPSDVKALKWTIGLAERDLEWLLKFIKEEGLSGQKN